MKKINLFGLRCSTILSIALVSASSWISGSAYAQCAGNQSPSPTAYSGQSSSTGCLAGALAPIGVINGVMDDAFNQPGSNLVASPKSDKACLLSELLAGGKCDVVGGPWVRGMGGQMTTTTTGMAIDSLGGGVQGSTIRQRVNYSGVQAGADSGLLNLEGIGVNAHVGVMGGHVSADAKIVDSASSDHFEVPFVGAYYVITKGSFMTDFTYRHSWYDMKLNEGFLGISNTPLNGQSDNVNASVSYKFALPDRYFIEPTANISYTRSTFDGLSVGYGTAALDFAPVTSLLGRAGLRFGTSFSYGGYNWSPYVLGLVENEFEKSSKATLAYNWGDYALSADRVGTFYQTSLGIAFQSQTSGLVGFARGDWQTGHKINGGGAVGGLRYSFGP